MLCVQDGWSTPSHDVPELTAWSSSKVQAGERTKRFSFECRPSETSDFQQNILKYVKNFGKNTKKVDLDSKVKESNHYYEVDDYNLQLSAQSLLFDRIFLKNRLESGSLLLCSGGIAHSASPFASII